MAGAKKRVDVTVTKTAGVKEVLIHIGMQQVLPGPGFADVEVGARPFLVWQFAGMPGDSVTITGKVGAQSVVDVTDTIPPGSIHGAGAIPFTVT
jgi:hypothetical protein